MKVLDFSIVTLIATALMACRSTAVKIKCTNADDLYYTSPESNCQAYYRCTSKGQHELKTCSPRSQFDFDKQTCVHSLAACHEPTCAGRSNGIYQDTSHACQRFYSCFAGLVTSIDNCPSKHLHNGQRCFHNDLVSCTSSLTESVPADEQCAGKANGHYAVNGSCTEYIACVDRMASGIKSCPSEQAFDAEKRQCLPKHFVKYCKHNESENSIDDLICKNKQDGVNIDPLSTDCSRYVICRGGKFESKQICRNQSVFDGENCVPRSLFECSHDSKFPGLCHRKPNGLHANPHYGCSLYVRCTNESIAELSKCPGDQYFDPESANCIREQFLERRRCLDLGKALDCNGKSNGFYHNIDCESYYHCHGEYKTEYKCLAGRVFNGKSCVHKSQYTCPETGGDPLCLFKADGYYADPNDSCHTYHYCVNGHKTTYLCEEGHIFDEKTKKCTRQTTDSQLHCRSDYICYGKSEGYHADYRSNCRSYVYCRNYKKYILLTCRNENVFNGQKCVPPTEYACPSLYNHKQVNCIPKRCAHRCEKDGFFPDLNRDCQEYFFCIGGKASRLSCPAGKLFDGEICVAEDKVNCPVLCEDRNESYKSCPLGGYVTTQLIH